MKYKNIHTGAYLRKKGSKLAIRHLSLICNEPVYLCHEVVPDGTVNIYQSFTGGLTKWGTAISEEEARRLIPDITHILTEYQKKENLHVSYFSIINKIPTEILKTELQIRGYKVNK